MQYNSTLSLSLSINKPPPSSNPLHPNSTLQNPPKRSVSMDHDMPGMTPSPPSTAGSAGHSSHDGMGSMAMAHMTFFWGKNSEILFSGWPGTRTGMYVLALFVVFFLAFFVELLSGFLHRDDKPGGLAGGLVRTAVHGVRIGLAYLVMLALMSFNGGVFIVAVVGHCLGFFVFGSRVFKRFSGEPDKPGYGNRVGC